MDTTQFIKESHDENMGILRRLENEIYEKEMSATEADLGDMRAESQKEDCDFRLEEDDLVK